MTQPEDPLAALPPALVEALGAAHFRSGGAARRSEALAQLCAAHPQHAETLRRAAAQWAIADGAAMPDAIGPYRIDALLGRGGYGEVYLAEQQAPVQRRVALKVLKRGMDSAAILQRFQREQEALARMSHDAIARIHDAGIADGGQPWFAMELVEGLPITRHCEQGRLGLRDRLQLAVAVCDGVQHAHQKGVVHRDLKPANVLVARVGARAAPKLIDFGIARALDHRGDGLTDSGSLLGTPAHMAPEQVSAEAGDVDTRTDVYALGVLLYELLTGALPFAGELGPSSTWLDVRRVLLTGSPKRPSQVDVPRARQEASWRSALAGDLDWIVLKAIAREPARRYASAAELGQDLGNYLAGLPVLAGPPTASYRLRKFVQRNLPQVLAAVAVLVTALLGAAATVRFAWLASERAEENAQLAVAAEAARDAAQGHEAAARATAELLAGALQDFRNLQGVVLAEQARAAQDELYPAWPERIAALTAWRDGDLARLRSMQPGVQAALASLRAKALPWSDAERERDRATHPQLGARELAERRLAAARRQVALARGDAPWREVDAPPAARDRSVAELMRLARMRAGPPGNGRTIYGEEGLGLAFARLSVAKAANQEERVDAQWTLVWALVEHGQDASALALAEQTMASIDAELRPNYERQFTRVRAAIAGREESLADAEAEFARLDAMVAARRTWTFPPDCGAESFLHDTLARLAVDVDRLVAVEAVDVQARLDWAVALRDRGLARAHPNAPATWAQARAAIDADPRYAGAIAWLPEGGWHDLAPLGANPATGLWEFYHLPSAWSGAGDPLALPIPRHAPDGSVALDDDAGIVFVLVPGGETRLGSQARAPDGAFFDAERAENEDLHRVVLAPFLVARHEVTQGQWQRLMRWDAERRVPSQYPFGPAIGGRNITRRHPVENVAASDCERMLARYGLELPTEAQWEHAARAGTTTPWTVPPAQLPLVGNFADAVTKRLSRTWACEAWDDGYAAHAPVGTFRPNAFGLFDVHGNVSEWCRDSDGPYGSERPGDGLRTAAGSLNQRYHRGGNWANLALKARSAARGTRQDGPDSTVGMRPVRNIAR